MMQGIVVLTSLFALVTGAEWGYQGDHGPDHWADNSNDCDGDKQSPIDIKMRQVEYHQDLDNFDFHGYDTVTGLKLQLINNGHAAQVNIEEGSLSISGGGLRERYHLAQFHFHWGSNIHRGSEHTMDGHKYPMEIHLVHYAERRRSLGDAANKPDGLAVLGFFFEIGAHNSHFDTIVNNLKNVKNAGNSTYITAFPIMSLLPETMTQYFRYSGSLTTPGCYESVVWTVFNDFIEISEEQMKQFRSLKADGRMIVDNFRPVQPLNGRNVYTNMRDDHTAGAGVPNPLPCIALLIPALLARLFS